MKKSSIPEWLILWVWRALLGEIYPEIRAIALSFSENRELKIRYYLTREPTDFDYESLSGVVTAVLAATSSNSEITNVIEECFFSEVPLSNIDVLDGLVYARREYDT